MNGYIELANAIIAIAAKDYREALMGLEMNPNNKEHRKAVRETERFFRSDWFSLLTDLDGEVLMRDIRKMAKEVTV